MHKYVFIRFKNWIPIQDHVRTIQINWSNLKKGLEVYSMNYNIDTENLILLLVSIFLLYSI